MAEQERPELRVRPFVVPVESRTRARTDSGLPGSVEGPLVGKARPNGGGHRATYLAPVAARVCASVLARVEDK